ALVISVPKPPANVHSFSLLIVSSLGSFSTHVFNSLSGNDAIGGGLAERPPGDLAITRHPGRPEHQDDDHHQANRDLLQAVGVGKRHAAQIDALLEPAQQL